MKKRVILKKKLVKPQFTILEFWNILEYFVRNHPSSNLTRPPTLYFFTLLLSLRLFPPPTFTAPKSPPEDLKPYVPSPR